MAHIDDPYTQKANLDFIRQSMDEPLLEKDHELDLARAWRNEGDENALHELVSSYTRLVISIASKFKHYGLPLGDLIQEGNVGLMQAADRFDPERDVRFSTYANWWIRSCIQDFVLRNWSIVRTGSTAAHKSLFFNFRRLRAKIENKEESEGLTPENHKEIAKELGVRVKDVEHMEARLAGVDSSLNIVVGSNSDSNGTEWLDMLCDETPTPEDITMSLKDDFTRSVWLDEALSHLSEREQKIIKNRYLSDDKATLENLGQDLGISKERVRQIETCAMAKLKTELSENISGNLF